MQGKREGISNSTLPFYLSLALKRQDTFQTISLYEWKTGRVNKMWSKPNSFLLYDLLSASFDSHEQLELQGGDSARSVH